MSGSFILKLLKTRDDKLSFLASVALAIPFCNKNSTTLIAERTWERRMLSNLSVNLGLTDDDVTAFLALVPVSYVTSQEEWDERAHLYDPFLSTLRDVKFKGTYLLVYMCVFLMYMNAFDAKGQCLLRNLNKVLYPYSNSAEIIAILSRFTLYIQITDGTNTTQSAQHSLVKASSSKWRYAKIGAATIGTGALLVNSF
jgi:hypothetical protein